MKGQYLAVESVITFAMGITLAIGTLGTFTTYQETVDETTTEKEAQIVNYKMKSAVYDLKTSYSGSKTIDLPEKIGGSEYTLVLDDGVKTLLPSQEFSSSMKNLYDYEMSGSVQGGEVKLYKSGNEYILRSS